MFIIYILPLYKLEVNSTFSNYESKRGKEEFPLSFELLGMIEE